MKLLPTPLGTVPAQRRSVAISAEDAINDGSALPPAPRSESGWPRWGTFALLLVGCGLALWIDVPVAAYFRAHPESFLQYTLRLELFGHGLGAVLICVAIFRLDSQWRQRLPRIAVAVAVAGLAANLLKLLIARNRPLSIELAQVNVWQTFTGWVPPFSTESYLRSFPSGHTATAVALALALAVAYPRGRWLFWFLGISAGLERIVSGHHFPSDVLAGAAVGWAAGCLMVRQLRSDQC